jgi:parvulin-like peptidyl-prolyl isomerase
MTESPPPAPSDLRHLLNFSQVNAARSFTFLAIGALSGLLIAGFGLFTAKGTSVHAVPAEDMALINQRPILKTDFVNQVEGEFGPPFSASTMAQREKVLRDMIREELYVQRGMELDMPGSDPDTRNALVAAVEQQVVAEATTQSPTDAQLRAYYTAHADHYAGEGTMTVVDYKAPDAVSAAAAAKAMAGGASAAAVAALFHLTDTRKTNGEEFYFAARIHLGDPLFNAAKALKSGQASAPITTPDGVHVLAMTANKPPVQQSFADARDKVLGDYKKDAETRLETAELAYLKGKADILIAPGYSQ